MRWLYFVVFVVLLLLVGWFGWPTPYEHYRVGDYVLRVHRISGEVERLTLGGWEPVRHRRVVNVEPVISAESTAVR